MADDDKRRGFFSSLGAFFKRLFLGKEAEGPLPAEVPESFEDLRRVIVENEEKGVDVNRAWRFYEKAKDAEQGSKEGTRYTEMAFNELSRKKQLRSASTSLLNYVLAIVVMALLVTVLWFLLKGNPFPAVRLAIWSPIVVILYLIRGLISSGFKIASARGVRVELPEKTPKNADELRALIFEYQGKGVKITQTQKLYEKARKLEEDNKLTEASLIVDKAYGDLCRKIVLFVTSRGAFFVCILALLIILGLLVGITKFHEFIESEQILRVPLFIVTWGLIGSMSYVLVSVYNDIRKQSFEWVDLAGYFYRFILGGVLAGVSFYVVQLGVTSLPGVAGEGVNAAVAGADDIADYRKAYFEKEDVKGIINDYRRLSAEFDLFKEERNVGELAAFLIENGDGWEVYRPKTEDGKIITAPMVKIELREYDDWNYKFKEASVQLEDCLFPLADAIYEIKPAGVLPEVSPEEEMPLAAEKLPASRDIAETKPTAPVEEGTTLTAEKPLTPQDVVKNFRDMPRDALDNRADYLLSDDIMGIWRNKVNVPGERSTEKYVEELKATLEYYKEAKERRNEKETIIRGIFVAVRKGARSGLTDDIAAGEKELRRFEGSVRKWTSVFESAELSERYPKLAAEINELEDQFKDIEKTYHSYLGSGGGEVKALFIENEVVKKRAELEKKERELALIRDKLGTALPRDLARPFWEAPIFVVIAFLSGFSVQFAQRILKQAEETAYQQIFGKQEKEDEGKATEDEGGPVG